MTDLEQFTQSIPCAPVGSPLVLSNKKKERSEEEEQKNNIFNNIVKERMAMNDDEIKRLKAQGFTNGLIQAVIQNNAAFPLRLWIIDNSGSMNTCDGQRIIPKSSMNDLVFIKSTRWAEIKDTVEYHSQMSAIRNAPTIFRFLNHPGVNVGTREFCIGFHTTRTQQEQLKSSPSASPSSVASASASASVESMADIQNASNILNKARPTGATPLIDRLLEIREALLIGELSPHAQYTQFEIKEGEKVAVIITTDGLPTIGGRHNYAVRSQFVETLRMFKSLPVWIVIRLCTEEEEVVEFYKELDEQLEEFSLEVLSDFVSEAKEVYKCNKWLNYALPLHRIREGGFHDKVLDILNERRLCAGELRDFCELLFGPSHFDGIDPEINWKRFLNVVNRLLEKEEGDKHYNPIKKKTTSWIDTKVLNKIYGKRRIHNMLCCS